MNDSSESQPDEAPSAGPTVPADGGVDDGHQPASYRFFAIVAVIAAALDLGSKEWVANHLTGGDPLRGVPKSLTVIKGFFDLQYAENPGGAWSILRSLPEIYRRPFFLFVSTVASVFIVSLNGRIDRRDWAMRWGLPLALGGAVGNLVDRARRGIVVDFLHCYATWGGRERHWPTFNVADVWIVIAVVLMFLSISGRVAHGQGAKLATDE